MNNSSIVEQIKEYDAAFWYVTCASTVLLHFPESYN